MHSLLLDLGGFPERPVRLDATRRGLQLEPRALHHLFDVCAPKQRSWVYEGSLFVLPPRTKDSHLFLFVHQLAFAHLALRESEREFDLPIALSHLEVERDEKRDNVRQTPT